MRSIEALPVCLAAILLFITFIGDLTCDLSACVFRVLQAETILYFVTFIIQINDSCSCLLYQLAFPLSWHHNTPDIPQYQCYDSWLGSQQRPCMRSEGSFNSRGKLHDMIQTHIRKVTENERIWLLNCCCYVTYKASGSNSTSGKRRRLLIHNNKVSYYATFFFIQWRDNNTLRLSESMCIKISVAVSREFEKF